jgi:dTDP-4-amino-4,6-dideoxygalactose transaminase
MNMEFIDLKSQYLSVKEAINQRIQTVLDHGQYINGPEVTELEEALCHYTKAKHCITCGNGTDALQLALMAYDIGPGDAVFTTSFSFFATAEAISLLGATPVFVDINPKTYNICPDSLRNTLQNYNGEATPRAIITVDLFGLPADYPAIKPIADEFDLKIIEDAAQGMGGKIGDDYAGTFGDISTTSFFPAKPLGCYGDGGALFTSHDDIADKLRSLKNHGKGNHKYEHIRIGLNSRLDTIQAAVLIEKLKILESEIEKRNSFAALYSQRLCDAVRIPTVPESYRSSWAQYTLGIDNRDKLQEELAKTKIPSQVYYPAPLHHQTAMQSNQILPRSERASQTVISLPISAYTSADTIELIASSIIKQRHIQG